MQILLQNLLHLHVLLALIFSCICPPFVPALVRIAFGTKWASTSAPQVLQAYCYFIPFLGVNGITEAFMQAVANSSEIARLSRVMWLWTAIYISACIFFIRGLGLQNTGLVYANMVNMACRIGYSLRFSKRYFGGKVLYTQNTSLPPVQVIAAFFVSACLVRSIPQPIDTAQASVKFMGYGAGIGTACLFAV